jgi:hypothetical protein
MQNKKKTHHHHTTTEQIEEHHLHLSSRLSPELVVVVVVRENVSPSLPLPLEIHFIIPTCIFHYCIGSSLQSLLGVNLRLVVGTRRIRVCENPNPKPPSWEPPSLSLPWSQFYTIPQQHLMRMRMGRKVNGLEWNVLFFLTKRKKIVSLALAWARDELREMKIWFHYSLILFYVSICITIIIWPIDRSLSLVG